MPTTSWTPATSSGPADVLQGRWLLMAVLLLASVAGVPALAGPFDGVKEENAEMWQCKNILADLKAEVSQLQDIRIDLSLDNDFNRYKSGREANKNKEWEAIKAMWDNRNKELSGHKQLLEDILGYLTRFTHVSPTPLLRIVEVPYKAPYSDFNAAHRKATEKLEQAIERVEKAHDYLVLNSGDYPRRESTLLTQTAFQQNANRDYLPPVRTAVDALEDALIAMYEAAVSAREHYLDLWDRECNRDMSEFEESYKKHSGNLSDLLEEKDALFEEFERLQTDLLAENKALKEMGTRFTRDTIEQYRSKREGHLTRIKELSTKLDQVIDAYHEMDAKIDQADFLADGVRHNLEEVREERMAEFERQYYQWARVVGFGDESNGLDTYQRLERGG